MAWLPHKCHPLLPSSSFWDQLRLNFNVRAAIANNEHWNQGIFLHPLEQDIIKPTWSFQTRKNFTLGRHAAHLALKELGNDSFPVLKSNSGHPIFPYNIKGSISHKDNRAICAVSNSPNIKAIGIDLELMNEPLTQDHAKLFFHPLELCNYEETLEKYHSLQVIFSLKEAIFKSLPAKIQHHTEFKDIKVSEYDNNPNEYLGYELLGNIITSVYVFSEAP
ncbi:4'-phosphopantetheinyl transferase superfamily protein [Marinilabiliaceae bacterium JC017]|nr:4'-phosphopantetheinyl transferase superfamily protein [Marinilabiliaceae bacterium JC017]